MVAVSSTACVLRLLTDRAEIDSEHSQMALGILLIQDTAVIPMMLLVSVMATGGTWGLIVGKLVLALVLAATLIGLFYILFNIVVLPFDTDGAIVAYAIQLYQNFFHTIRIPRAAGGDKVPTIVAMTERAVAAE